MARRSSAPTTTARRPAETSRQQLLGGEISALSPGDPQWVRDDDDAAAQCCGCGASFGLLRRRHHCRVCGQVFCRACTPLTVACATGHQTGPAKMERACGACHAACTAHAAKVFSWQQQATGGEVGVTEVATIAEHLESNLHIGATAAHDYAAKLVDDGYDTVAAFAQLELHELEVDFGFKTGHLRLVQNARAELGSASDISALVDARPDPAPGDAREKAQLQPALRLSTRPGHSEGSDPPRPHECSDEEDGHDDPVAPPEAEPTAIASDSRHSANEKDAPGAPQIDDTGLHSTGAQPISQLKAAIAVPQGKGRGGNLGGGDSVNAVRDMLIAAGAGELETVRQLCRGGVDVNAADATVCQGSTALHVAAQNGHVEVLEYLMLGAGADVEAQTMQGGTALQYAAQNGRVKALELLLSTNIGANVEAQDKQGSTALLLAAGNGHVEVLKLLLSAEVRANVEAQAKVEAQNKQGWTALHLAAGNGHVEVLEYLLGAGADVEAQTTEGATALHVATQNGHVEVLKLLLSAEVGAHVEVQSEEGATALHYAAQSGHMEVLQYLLSANVGANVEARRPEDVSEIRTLDDLAAVHSTTDKEVAELLSEEKLEAELTKHNVGVIDSAKIVEEHKLLRMGAEERAYEELKRSVELLQTALDAFVSGYRKNPHGTADELVSSLAQPLLAAHQDCLDSWDSNYVYLRTHFKDAVDNLLNAFKLQFTQLLMKEPSASAAACAPPQSWRGWVGEFTKFLYEFRDNFERNFAQLRRLAAERFAREPTPGPKQPEMNTCTVLSIGSSSDRGTKNIGGSMLREIKHLNVLNEHKPQSEHITQPCAEMSDVFQMLTTHRHCHGLHLSGHGEHGGVLFVSTFDVSTMFVDAADKNRWIAKAICDSMESLCFVVINACRSDALARALLQQRPELLVLCWRSNVDTGACEVLTRFFYRNLCTLRQQGKPTADAAREAACSTVTYLRAEGVLRKSHSRGTIINDLAVGDDGQLTEGEELEPEPEPEPKRVDASSDPALGDARDVAQCPLELLVLMLQGHGEGSDASREFEEEDELDPATVVPQRRERGGNLGGDDDDNEDEDEYLGAEGFLRKPHEGTAINGSSEGLETRLAPEPQGESTSSLLPFELLQEAFLGLPSEITDTLRLPIELNRLLHAGSSIVLRGNDSDSDTAPRKRAAASDDHPPKKRRPNVKVPVMWTDALLRAMFLERHPGIPAPFLDNCMSDMAEMARKLNEQAQASPHTPANNELGPVVVLEAPVQPIAVPKRKRKQSKHQASQERVQREILQKLKEDPRITPTWNWESFKTSLSILYQMQRGNLQTGEYEGWRLCTRREKPQSSQVEKTLEVARTSSEVICKMAASDDCDLVAIVLNDLVFNFRKYSNVMGGNSSDAASAQKASLVEIDELAESSPPGPPPRCSLVGTAVAVGVPVRTSETNDEELEDDTVLEDQIAALVEGGQDELLAFEGPSDAEEGAEEGSDVEGWAWRATS